jgi:hypothetical protein
MKTGDIAMVSDAGNNFSDTFIVWNDEINLVAALIPFKNGQAGICGTAKFKNGEQLAMFSRPDDYEILHKRIVVACRWIADLYGTHVVCSRCPATSVEKFEPVNSRIFNNLAKILDRPRAHKILGYLN